MLAAIAASLAACSANQPKFGGVSNGLHCVDDSDACIDKRRFALNSLLADKQKSWIKRPPSPEAYASGGRLFAYQTQKKQLSCDDLASGIREASGARASLKSASNRLTAQQIARSAMLGDEVSRELTRERQRRCTSR